MKRRLLLSIVAVVATVAASLVAPVAAQETTPEKFAGTPAEMELIETIDKLYKEFEAIHAKAEEITDPVQRDQFYEENDPLTHVVPKLLELEQENQGTHVGLMALRRILQLAGGSGDPDSPAILGRREAYQRLPNYADDPLVAGIVRSVRYGATDPSTEQLLRSLAQNANANELVREVSKLTLAEWMLSCSQSREYTERRLQELRGGEALRYPQEKEMLERTLEIYATMPQMQSWQSEALDLLREVANSGRDIRLPAVKARDPRWYLIQIDDQPKQSPPRLSEIAEGVLFKELHLRVGKPAPELDVTLVNENSWSLASQRGKVVIIMFSFKGCGPCEAMYPDLRDLQKSHPDSLSILSIMADENRQDTLDAVAEGKLTWNVHWDGGRGPLTTRWAVTGFPEIYVIDRSGEVAGYELRGQELRDKVAQLLNDK
jgi:thiol-disulfide isomerase/thioredoxin